VANPEEKNADHLVPPLGLPTEYYPFKRCQVPVGHPVSALKNIGVKVLIMLLISGGEITDAMYRICTVTMDNKFMEKTLSGKW